MFTPVKVSGMAEEIGLDESIHGEHAYEDVLGVADLVHSAIAVHEEELLTGRK
jgi:hypothetical protein